MGQGLHRVWTSATADARVDEFIGMVETIRAGPGRPHTHSDSAQQLIGPWMLIGVQPAVGRDQPCSAWRVAGLIWGPGNDRVRTGAWPHLDNNTSQFNVLGNRLLRTRDYSYFVPSPASLQELYSLPYNGTRLIYFALGSKCNCRSSW